MDRTGIIAIVAVIIAVAIWDVNYTHQRNKYDEYQKAQKALADAAEADARAKAPPVPETVAAAPAPTGVEPASPPAAKSVPENLQKVPTPSVDYTFTNLGGGISRAVLLKHVAEHSGPQALDRETNVTLNEFGATPIGAIVEHPGEETRVPFASQVNPDTGEASFERTDSRQLQTTKLFKVSKAPDFKTEYLVGLDVTFTNRSSQPIQVGNYYVHTGSAGPIHALDQALYTGFDWYNGSNVFKGVSSFGSSGFLGFGRTEASVVSQSVENLSWAAVTNQYFCTLITPANAKASAVWTQKIGVTDLPASDPRVLAASGSGKANMQAVEGALGMAGFNLAPGASSSQHFDIYAGPREYARLKTMGGEQEAVMDFGYFKLVSEALLNSLNWLKAHLGSYAAAIIVLTLIIRSGMWPLQNKSTESMKKMQTLAPEVNKLKEKYKDDPARMNQEMMKLYKDYGVNPLSGCLPMVVQVPIFWGLFRMLGKAVELRNSHFLWVHDLSQPDTVAMYFGKPLNILPLCMAVTMFFQMRLSPKSGDAAQQKIFMLMPVIFVVFCYNYASALALYWTVQNLFSIGQLYVTRNKLTPTLQRVAGPGKKKGRA